VASRPEVERALVRANATPSLEEANRFYAGRVSDYARVLALVFGGVYAAGIVLVLLIAPESFVAFHLHPAKIANLAFVIVCLAVWRLTRRPQSPAWFAVVGDLALPPSIALAVAVVVHSLPALSGVWSIPLLVAALLLSVRAALIPSPASRSALVGILTGGPVTWAGYALASRDPGLQAPLTPQLATVIVGAWCMALSAATAQISKVIYGLQREIASARKLGQYVLGDLIGEGGMGAVYRAEHALLRRPTAIKLLLPERTGPENLQRFEREVQLTAKLSHPNTVQIYDYGRTPDGIFYYAMEYLDGVTLEELVRRFGPQPPGRVVNILMQTAAALSEAHALGLIHRDIKPSNILFCERGGVPDTVKLVDFGLVKHLVPSQGVELTQTDAITGTPQYMAPESILDPTSIDHRVDLYALGGVGYFLLCGRSPFEGASVLEVCGHHLHTPAEPPSRKLGTELPAALEALVLGCLEKKPEQRPRDADELYQALLECARTLPWSLADARSWWSEFREAERTGSRAPN
jgi:eukaryotic-like serine/threonine-protein kinase